MSTVDVEQIMPARHVRKFQQAYTAGQPVFAAGDRGSSMYVVLEGSVRIEAQKNGATRLVARCEAGDFFGETALVDAGIRSASAIADATPTRLAEIDKARFMYLVGQQPVFALTMIRELCRRIRSIQGLDGSAHGNA